MKISLVDIQAAIDNDLITCQSHPYLPLKIYKYTATTTFKAIWNDITRIARGLVLDDEGNIVINCMPKFFNNSEVQSNFETNRLLKYTTTEKFDGSLIQASMYKGELIVTSSGSFISKQAVKAREIINKFNYRFKPNFTYIFELIYPENRIVINYGDDVSLKCITIRDNESNNEFDPNSIDMPFDCLKHVNITLDEMLIEQKRADFINKEGWVVHFENGERVKIKYDEYVRLHKIVSGINEKFVWEYLSEDKDFEDVLQRVPDELYQFVKNYSQKLLDKFSKIEGDCLDIFEKNKHLEKREFAMIAKDSKYSSVIFSMYKHKDKIYKMIRQEYHKIIWKILKPAISTRFGIGDVN